MGLFFVACGARHDIALQPLERLPHHPHRLRAVGTPVRDSARGARASVTGARGLGRAEAETAARPTALRIQEALRGWEAGRPGETPGAAAPPLGADPFVLEFDAWPGATHGATAPPPSLATDPRGLMDWLWRSPTMRLRFPGPDPRFLRLVIPVGPGARRPAPGRAVPATRTLATPTLIVEGARRDDLKAAHGLGARIVHEGYDGKVLLRVERLDRVFAVAEALRRRDVGAVAPNFLHRVVRPGPSRPQRAWAHRKIGVRAAWKITRGSADIAVAVLDEGVDTSHPALRPAAIAERDFIGGNGNSAMPDGDDAHGTACAGVALSRDDRIPGIAPQCSLIAARIAMDDGYGHWIFDDYATADAIDWCWRRGAAVLSNSWGGGLPSDAIARALGRARTQGRGGKGAIVVIAAGNDQAPIDFPGDLPGYVTVGASTPKDERKTRTSADGETRWGSNYGPTMSLLAPGVFIRTTDIAGPRGYSSHDLTRTFNGTSAATPHVAGTAALMLSANPALAADEVRILLQQTARRLGGQTGWTPELGWGRLRVGKAVAAA